MHFFSEYVLASQKQEIFIEIEKQRELIQLNEIFQNAYSPLKLTNTFQNKNYYFENNIIE